MRAVIVSVNYGDLLADTLPAWQAILPNGSLSVATSSEDIETQDVCARAHVQTIITDAWTRRDPVVHVDGEPTFNFALGIDVSLGLAEHQVPRPAMGEVVAHINADCYPIGVFPRDRDLKLGVLYGFWRWPCPTPADLIDVRNGRRTVDSLGRHLKNSSGRPVGYFQMWRYGGERFGSYPTAGHCDTHFCRRWMETPGHRMEMRDDLKLLHLGDAVDWANWAGRVVPRWESVSA